MQRDHRWIPVIPVFPGIREKHKGLGDTFAGQGEIDLGDGFSVNVTHSTPYGVDPETLASVNDSNTHFIEGDHDVFEDGQVRILRAPGHTPGHQVLLLTLANTGTVTLSGDLYHTRENFNFSRVAALNHSRAETLASFDRITRLMDRYGARMIIQHDPDDIAALPASPQYLD